MKYFAFLMSLVLLVSCGKSVDKNSFEGRVASFIAVQDGVFTAISMDLKNIIEKSGIKDGAIPDQYLSTITPYMDALTKSINLEKQIYLMPDPKNSKSERSDFVLMFEVGDLNSLKKEIKEIGINLKKKGSLEYGLKTGMAFGIYKGETAFFVFKEKGSIAENTLIEFGENMSKGKTIEGVVDFVTTKSDVVAFYTGDKMSNLNFGDYVPELKALDGKKTNLYEGTYWLAKVDFNDQDALMEVDINIGKNLKKYAPFLRSSLSDESKNILIDENTVMAFALNANMERLIALFFDQLDDKTKDEMNKQLSMLGGTEKFKQLFTGEFAFAMSADNDPQFNAFIGIGDQKQVQSLLDGLGFFLGIKKNGNIYDMDGAQMMFTDKGLVYAANADMMSKMKAKKSQKLRDLGGFKFGASPMSLFINFKAMVNLEDAEDFTEIYKAFDFMVLEMSDKGGKGLIRSTKKGQNILRTLIESFIEMQRIDEIREAERQAMYDEMWGDDWSDDDWDEFYGSEDWDDTW
jgi:hypothetical protein